jgi:hypothetical protein
VGPPVLEGHGLRRYVFNIIVQTETNCPGVTSNVIKSSIHHFRLYHQGITRQSEIIDVGPAKRGPLIRWLLFKTIPIRSMPTVGHN